MGFRFRIFVFFGLGSLVWIFRVEGFESGHFGHLGFLRSRVFGIRVFELRVFGIVGVAFFVCVLWFLWVEGL